MLVVGHTRIKRVGSKPLQEVRCRYNMPFLHRCKVIYTDPTVLLSLSFPGKSAVHYVSSRVGSSHGNFSFPHSLVTVGQRFFITAFNADFTKGRQRDQVAAACLYLACRTEKAAYLLMDFSSVMNVCVSRIVVKWRIKWISDCR